MKKIKIYSTPTCPYCQMAKKYFDEKGIEYEDIDVSKDRESAKYIMQKSGQMGVPQIEIGEKVIVGFDKEAIAKEIS